VNQRPQGLITRGTTNPNRLRRMDNWIAARFGRALAGAADPLVIDLGFGASPITVIELRRRLMAVRPDVRVLGLEIDPARVAAATPYADPPGLLFGRGGFELAGEHPVIVRAANVLRQYDLAAVQPAWDKVTSSGAVLIDGTCDEVGRLACWLQVTAAGPVSLTLSARLSTLVRPATLAERLPKALIHRNTPGEPIHALLAALDDAWRVHAGLGTFGARQRWRAACADVRAAGFPVLDRADRWRLGELTVAWSAVAPRSP
jgi:hypothetical protein